MEQNLDRGFDKQLNSVKNLTWLPWVGKNYTKSKYKVLIVGESHYADAKDDAQKIIDIEKALNNKDFTRLCIHEAAIEESWRKNPPTLTNIKRLLLGKSFCGDETREKLWSQVGYYNFIQSVMGTKKDRPIEISYYDS
ncbi:MAG: hypothetical protein KKD38_09390, partial [Candidatus Delongbacteria bacterium]|nr:hypothetical protein [Candidatus Delongbacteria bacterium]MCG2760072.1 hypothetical protein [Candidatus Delongbacteria bacterium]